MSKLEENTPEENGTNQVGGSDVSTDPFAPENVGAFQLVTLMRIYDALMALLETQDGDMADLVSQVHARGGIVGSVPFIDLQEQSSDLQPEEDNE